MSIVQFGDDREKIKNGEDADNPIKVYGGKQIPEELLKKLKQKCEIENIKITYIKEQLCKDEEILIDMNKWQERVAVLLFQILESNQEEYKDIRVWCDGHLPIRRIIVGPSQDAELIKESVEQYKSHCYWLKHVKVVISDYTF